jgi:colicin import membrane protein
VTTTLAIGNPDEFIDIRWTSMVTLSAFLHLIVFCIILFLPESTSSWRQIEGIIYEVDLVPMSSEIMSRLDAATPANVGTVTRKESQAKRIGVPEKEEKPLVVAKKIVTKKETKLKITPSQLIDSAITRIEKKVKNDDKNHIEKAISELGKKVEGGTGSRGGMAGGQGSVGIPIRIYQMEVENRIKGNWSYAVAVKDLKKLQAIVVVKVKQDGTILESWFKERSGDTIFDQSVLKAVEKSDPLPPFPEGYLKSYDEIEINFNLRDLEEK